MKNSCENKKKVNRSPGHNRSECFKAVFLEVASAAESGLAFLDLTVWGPLHAKHPSARDDLGLCIRDVDFIPGVDHFQLRDLDVHGLSPLLNVVGVLHGLFIGHGVRITDGCHVSCRRSTTRVHV